MTTKIPRCPKCGYMVAAWTERDTYEGKDTFCWRCVNQKCEVCMERIEPEWIMVKTI